MSDLDDHAHWRLWERRVDPQESKEQAVRAQHANAEAGHEAPDAFLKRWQHAVWTDKSKVRYTREDLTDKSQDWQQRLNYMKRHNIDYN